MIKRMSFLTAKDGMTCEDFVTYWRDVHAPKAAQLPGLLHYSIGILDGEAPMRGATGAPIIGYGMLLFGSEEEVAAAYASPEGQEAAADLRSFAEEVLRYDVKELTLIV